MRLVPIIPFKGLQPPNSWQRQKKGNSAVKNGPNSESHELLDNSQRPRSSKRRHRSCSHYVSVMLHSTGLSILYIPLAKLFGWDQGDEEETKVVMDRRRPLAVARCVVHVVPIAAAFTLVVLNASNYISAVNYQGHQEMTSRNWQRFNLRPSCMSYSC